MGGNDNEKQYQKVRVEKGTVNIQQRIVFCDIRRRQDKGFGCEEQQMGFKMFGKRICQSIM